MKYVIGILMCVLLQVCILLLDEVLDNQNNIEQRQFDILRGQIKNAEMILDK